MRHRKAPASWSCGFHCTPPRSASKEEEEEGEEGEKREKGRGRGEGEEGGGGGGGAHFRGKFTSFKKAYLGQSKVSSIQKCLFPGVVL